MFESGPELDAAAPTGNSTRIEVAAACDFTRALLLTYDCEIDKPATKHLTLALVRPFDPSMPEQARQIIRENRKFSAFFLPAGAGMAESIVDFMRLSTLPKDVLQGAHRIACLSNETRQAMLYQLIRFLCRIDMSNVAVPPPV